VARVAGLSPCRGHSDAGFASPGNTQSLSPAPARCWRVSGNAEKTKSRKRSRHGFSGARRRGSAPDQTPGSIVLLRFQCRQGRATSDKRPYVNYSERRSVVVGRDPDRQTVVPLRFPAHQSRTALQTSASLCSSSTRFEPPILDPCLHVRIALDVANPVRSSKSLPHD
jgi:hypothetical protein